MGKEKYTLYQTECIHAAHDFNYPEHVIKQILETKDEDKLSMIMERARKKYL